MKTNISKYFVIFYLIFVLNIFWNALAWSQYSDSTIHENYTITLLNDSINSGYDDFAPFYIKNYNYLIFTSDRPSKHDEFNRQNLLFSRMIDSIWFSSRYLGTPVNTKYNEGGFTYSEQTKMAYFARQIKNNTDIYQVMIEISDSGITILQTPEKCKIINSPYWDSEPSISKDGKTLYFASNRPGGFGGSDIWISKMDDQGNWSEPLNAGGKINSSGNEFAPFISPDGQKLYFSSDGHGGIGNLDFFNSSLDSAGWSDPQNLEFLNSKNNELFLSFYDTTLIFFSSDRKSGDYDIYSATLSKPEELKKNVDNTTFRSWTYDIRNNQPINNYSVSIIDKQNNKIHDSKITRIRPNQFSVEMACNNSYIISFTAPDYLICKERITIDSCKEDILRKIFLYPIEWNFQLNISFTDTMTTLNVYAIKGLDSAYNILFNNPEISAEIAVHSDSTNEWANSVRLTWLRAESIRNYLVERGIASDRLKSKGYGSLEPIAPNSTEIGRKMNRRVELRTHKK
jgi:outer membrane protein OmpA-like peptidoglycan-associated protein